MIDKLGNLLGEIKKWQKIQGEKKTEPVSPDIVFDKLINWNRIIVEEIIKITNVYISEKERDRTEINPTGKDSLQVKIIRDCFRLKF